MKTMSDITLQKETWYLSGKERRTPLSIQSTAYPPKRLFILDLAKAIEERANVPPFELNGAETKENETD